MSRFLLIGGAGLLGAHLGPALQLAGHDVGIVDRFSGSMFLRTSKDYPVYKADATDYNGMVPVMAKFQPDVVVVMVNYYYSRDQYYSAYEEGRMTVGTANTVCSVLNRNIKHVYLCSHSDVYDGSESGRGLSEDKRIHTPVSYRGAANLAAEYMFTTRCDELDIPLTVLRIFDMVGPRLMFTPVSCRLNFLVDSFLKGEQIGLVGSNKRRDFIHVKDVVAAIVGLHANEFSGVVNIGTGVGLTLNQICKELAKSMKIQYSPIEITDRPAYAAVADIDKLTEAVSWWEPKTDVLEYLPELVEFRRKENHYYRPENAATVLRDQRNG